MKAAFGIVGLLVCVGVIVWIMASAWLPQTQAVLQTQKKVQPQVQQISGHDTDGTDARESIKLDAVSSGGKMKSVVVTQINAGGAMERYFGLQKGDEIVEIASQGEAFTPVREMSEPGAAKDELLRSYQNSQKIVVIRNGQKVTLPAAPPPQKPGVPAASPVQKQLENIGVPAQ